MFGLEKELEEKVERKTSQFYQILKKCLKIKDENILIISDYGEKERQLSTMLSYGYYHAAKKKGLKVEILFQERKKGFMHADHHVIKALEKLNKGSIKLKESNVLASIKKFVKRVKKNRNVTMNFINKKIKEGKKIFLYGASTKGNTLLQYYNLNGKIIPFAAEKSPEKWGKYTIGTGIKIISEKQARSLKPDYFLVTPWGFIKEFVKRESKWLKNGGKFILPFPKFKLVK